MLRGVGPARGVIDFEDSAVGHGDLVAHAGRGGDEVEVVLALQPLLNDLKVQQAEEAAAEAEAERDRRLRLEGEAGVVEAKFFERVAQHGVLVRVDGVEAGEDHALDVFKTRQRLGAGTRDLGDGVADLGIGHVLDRRDEEAYLACGELGEGDRLGRHHAHALHVERLPIRHDLDLHPLAQPPVDDARQHDDAAVGVEP